MEVVSVQGVLLIATVLGTVAFAVSGVLVAAESDMDWLGAVVLSIVTAVGGGSMRDVLLGQDRVGWVADPWPVAVSIGVAGVMVAVLRLRPRSDPRQARWFAVSDAVGLGAFSVTGVAISIDQGTSLFIAVLMGVVSGVGGGVLRDVLARRTPLVLVGEIYALAGLAGAATTVVLHEVGAARGWQVWVSMAVVVAVRLVAVRLDLALPKILRR
jgi:uncharacterized membrane protein YeiH